ncbi:fructokinase [Lachnospiraceae bacterium KM106-2]|nr:fructokinase [Lachnospiraceae bacterium KM106-2]
MSKLLAIGEALIDFIPGQTGRKIKEVEDFKPVVGGAPANVCGAFTKLGGDSALITQLGCDPFGDKIVDEFSSHGISCDYIKRTTKANTSLAFVALESDGNREFSFYRKPGADMLLDASEVEQKWFEDAYALHFCSVSLGDFPMKEAHRKAIEYAKEAKAVISFDPNVRLALWEDQEALRRTILEFLPLADIIKISDEELEFITGKKTIEDAKEILFQGSTKLVIYTKGSDGAEAYTKTTKAEIPGKKVAALDTTGAGDAFIGSFLYQLYEAKITPASLETISDKQLEDCLTFSNEYCAKSVMKKGAIASYPTMNEMR